ncbi:hypothetical protein Anas_00864 [Armadillidium nasatum]|uniref:Protein FAM122A n=1 Tax=Armadillidium nasatum TaxID=96803 RepID=A0A5N5SJE2_9CRUS|nr:hypothetical protein Anas_00864 [Armadillidium nasatum]
MEVHSPGSSRSIGRMRVCQLREEEGMDIVNREAAHERTVHSSLQVAQTLSQSWEDLALVKYSTCGASPTRVGRQCFSPSLQQPVRNYSFCPSPSPTKKTFTTRRSLSPIPLRPSPLGGIKRKWELEDAFITPNKRLSTCTPDRCSGGLLITHPHSLESTPSPAGGGSLGSVGTPESVCSSGSPGPPPPSYSPAPTPDPPPHLFKPVSPALSGSHSHSYSHVGEQSERFCVKPSSIGEGSDASSDAMITEDTPMTSTQDMKSYQEMDLSETLSHETLNI